MIKSGFKKIKKRFIKLFKTAPVVGNIFEFIEQAIDSILEKRLNV